MSAYSEHRKATVTSSQTALLLHLRKVVGHKHLLTDSNSTYPYQTGFRYGHGRVLAVVRPGSLIELWRISQICVEADAIIIMQASNTGLTGGSTPDGDDYDRDVVLISTLRLDKINLIDGGKQVVCLPGATLFNLENQLKPVGREPHSVIGSSCIGASVFGGICNNSGGALVRRGPAFTELALYGQIAADGRLHLINHLGIRLGHDPEEILRRVEEIAYTPEDIERDERRASDVDYETRVRDVTAGTPARFNADPDRLYQASGSAGHLILFALRLDTFPAEAESTVYYIGTDTPSDLESIRRGMLSSDLALPIAAEYMHRDIFDITRVYGKDMFLAIKYLGTDRLPALFKWKAKIDAWSSRLSLLPYGLSDRLMQAISRLFPEHRKRSTNPIFPAGRLIRQAMSCSFQRAERDDGESAILVGSLGSDRQRAHHDQGVCRA